MNSEANYLDILKVLADVLPGIFYRCRNDADFSVEEIRGDCLGLTGYQPEELLQHQLISYDKLIHADDRKMVELEIQTALKEKRSYLITYRIQPANGSLKWVWEQGKGLFDSEGTLTGLAGFITDITLQKESERALSDSAEVFRVVFEHVGVGISLIDANGKIVDCNKALQQMLGYSKNELKEKTIKELTHPDDYDKENKILEEALQGNKDAHYKLDKRYFRKDGQLLWVRLSASVVHDSEGKLVFGVGVIEDISERKLNEKVQNAILEITNAVMRTSNLAALFKEIHDILATLTHVENFYIALCNNQDGLIHFPYYVDEFDEAPDPTPPGKGLTEYVMKTGKPLLAGPELFSKMVQRGEVEMIGAPSIDWLGVPLRKGDKVMGVMVAQSYTEGVRFSEKDLHIFEIVSNQVALAIERKQTEDALRSEESKLRTMFDASTDAIFLETLDGRILDCNEVALEMFGYTREEILNLTVMDLLPEDTRKQIPLIINQELMEGGFQIVSKNQRKDGSLFSVEVSTRMTMIGEQRLVVAYVRDITEREMVENAIRDSEAKFRELAETTTALIAIVKGNCFLYVNPAYLALTGYSESETMAMDFSLLLFENERDNLLQQMEERLRGRGTAGSTEVRIRTKTGEEKWVEATTGLVEFQGEKAILLTAIDITDRYLAESQMRLQSAALESAANAIVITDRFGTITWVNQAFTSMTGYLPEEAAGHTLDLLNSGVQDGIFFDRLWETILAGQIWHGELINRRKDGSLYDEEMTITPVLTPGGELLNFVAIKQDITERTQHHRELTAIARVTEALRTAITRADILPLVLDQVFNLLHAKGVMLALQDRLTGETVIQACKGEWEKIAGNRMPHGVGISGRVIETGQVYLTRDIKQDPFITFPEYSKAVLSIGCAPLIVQQQTIGSIMVGVGASLSSDDMRILTAIADIAGSAIHRAELFEQTRSQAAELAQAYDATIEGWARAMELRDKETQGHTRRVMQMTIRLAQTLGVISSDLEKMRRGVLLHDIGKMGVPDNILLKKGTLNEEEWEIMRQHPRYAYEMLQPIPYLRSSLDIPYSHHEHWDGSGYPLGLKGETIPFSARIFAVVDNWDALTYDRPYRAAWSRKEVITYLRKQRGILFDPRVVDAFLELVKAGEI